MALLAITGAETGHQTAEGFEVDGAGVTSDTAVAHGSHARSASWKFVRDNTQGNLRSSASFVGVSGRRYWIRAHVERIGAGNQNAIIIQYGSGPTVGTRVGWTVRLKTDGTIGLYEAASGTEVAPLGSNAPLSTTEFTLIEFGQTITTGGGTDSCELWVDGVKTHEASSNITDTLANYLMFGWVGAPNNVVTANRTLYFDGVLLYDSTGASFNARVGAGYVAHMRPVSDSARVGWTNGNAGTTNLFDGLDNVPPTGEVTTGATATSQVEDALNNATDNYTANIESYDTASIPSGSQIRAVVPMACVGTSSLTGTNDGHVRVVTNPNDGVADATVNMSFEASGVVAAAFPTGWIAQLGTPVYSPTVTRATQPTWRVGKRTASTRVMAACCGGLFVEYEAAPPDPRFMATA